MQRLKNFKERNEGMSLIELVVVVLIIGVLAATGFVGISQMNRYDATSAAGKIESFLELTRMQTLACDKNAEVQFQLYKKADGSFYGKITKLEGTNRITIEEEEICSKSVGLSVYNGATASSVDSDGLIFTYKKSNGSFTSEYDKIVVSGGKSKTINLVKETGRCFVQ